MPQNRERKMPQPKPDWRAVSPYLRMDADRWAVLDENNNLICEGLTEAQAKLIEAAPAKEALCEELADALEALLPVAQHFERQSSRGSGGRRGYVVFGKARAALKAAGRAPG